MAKKELVVKLGIKRENQKYMYFVVGNGDVYRTKRASGGKKGGQREKIASIGQKKDNNYLYYLDGKGDVYRVGRKKR